MYEDLYRRAVKNIEELERRLRACNLARQSEVDDNRVLRLRLEVLHGNAGSVQNRLGLKPQEFRIAHYLANRSPGTVTKDVLLEARRAPNDCGVESVQLKLVDVQVSHARKQLRKHDIAIQTDWGQGYYMEDADAERFTRLIYGADT